MLELLEVSAKLTSATVIGGLIGLNRDLHDKPSGMRTLSIVGLAAASATTLVADDMDAASRVIQGLVTGIGFLGAGVIIHNRAEGEVEGMTTAASIWLTTCIGAACGLGAWRLVLVSALLTGIVLIGGKRFKEAITRLFYEPRAADAAGKPTDDNATKN
ncbi:MAG: MgtC/SapB family protein [Hyphomicrobiaceae bacterium]